MPFTSPEIRPTTNDRTDKKGTVLVLGATGQQGGAVADALRASGWPVRALVRAPGGEKAQRLSAGGVEVFRGDLDDTNSIRAAMAGVHGVFSVQPSSGQGPAYGVTDEQEIRWGKDIADAALAAGVRHLVYTSVNAVGRGPTGMGHFDSKFEIEEYIRSLNMRSTIIRPAAFMELLMLPGMGLDQGYFSFFLRPDQIAQIIAVRDIGTIVAAVFAAPDRFAGRSFEIASDEVTGAQLGVRLSKAAGRPITYLRFPDAVLEGDAFLGRLASLVDDGRLAGNADVGTLRQEFGALTSFDEWISGTGKPLLDRALQTEDVVVSLR